MCGVGELFELNERIDILRGIRIMFSLMLKDHVTPVQCVEFSGIFLCFGFVYIQKISHVSMVLNTVKTFI